MSGQQHSLKKVQHNTVNSNIPTKTKRKTGTHTNTRCNTQKTYTSTHKQNQRMKCMGQLKRIQLPPRRAQFSFYVCVPVCLYLSQIVFMSCTKWTHLPFPPGYQKDTMTFCMYLCIVSDSHSSMQLLLCSFAPLLLPLSLPMQSSCSTCIATETNLFGGPRIANNTLCTDHSGV